LGIEVYLQTYFKADERVHLAQLAVDEVQVPADARQEGLKAIFHDRARAYRENMRKLLRSDGVPAPHDQSQRWMLYGLRNSSLVIAQDGASISCRLCTKCCDALSARNASGQPSPCLSSDARARGLWIAPEPRAIEVLSWAERNVLRLGRTYQCIKRVYQSAAPWASGNVAATPQYTTRNVVSFPQDADTAIAKLCLLPEDLAKVLFVQFVGSNKQVVLNDPALQVDVEHLRAGFIWFLGHNW